MQTKLIHKECMGQAAMLIYVVLDGKEFQGKIVETSMNDISSYKFYGGNSWSLPFWKVSIQGYCLSHEELAREFSENFCRSL